MGDSVAHARYREVRKLGHGNFGAAWLVQDLQSDREWKVLKRVFVGTLKETDSAGALREAKLLSQLEHPNILKFHESFIDKDFVCIVTEYCEGGDLAEKIESVKEEGGVIQQQQVLDWFVQLTMALKYLHERGVLHRDLKSKNVFLKRGVIKLGDFGIARVLMGTTDEATTFAGTPYYMSPEALQGIGYNDKSDIWALGCILFEMCTLKHAFDGAGLLSLLYQICEGDVPQLPDHYDKELKQLSTWLWQRDPVLRPSAVAILNTPLVRRHMYKWQFRLSKRSNRSIDEERERIRSQVGHTKRSSRHSRRTPHRHRDGEGDAQPQDAQRGGSGSSSNKNNNGNNGSGAPAPFAPPRIASAAAARHDERQPSAAAERAGPIEGKDERHLTPRERMKLRKLRASEQRAAQLKQAAMQQRRENRSRQQHTRDHLQSSNLAHALFGQKAAPVFLSGTQGRRHADAEETVVAQHSDTAASSTLVAGSNERWDNSWVSGGGTLVAEQGRGQHNMATARSQQGSFFATAEGTSDELGGDDTFASSSLLSRTASDVDEFELVAANAAAFLAESQRDNPFLDAVPPLDESAEHAGSSPVKHIDDNAIPAAGVDNDGADCGGNHEQHTLPSPQQQQRQQQLSPPVPALESARAARRSPSPSPDSRPIRPAAQYQQQREEHYASDNGGLHSPRSSPSPVSSPSTLRRQQAVCQHPPTAQGAGSERGSASQARSGARAASGRSRLPRAAEMTRQGSHQHRTGRTGMSAASDAAAGTTSGSACGGGHDYSQSSSHTDTACHVSSRGDLASGAAKQEAPRTSSAHQRGASSPTLLDLTTPATPQLASPTARSPSASSASRRRVHRNHAGNRSTATAVGAVGEDKHEETAGSASKQRGHGANQALDAGSSSRGGGGGGQTLDIATLLRRADQGRRRQEQEKLSNSAPIDFSAWHGANELSDDETGGGKDGDDDNDGDGDDVGCGGGGGGGHATGDAGTGKRGSFSGQRRLTRSLNSRQWSREWQQGERSNSSSSVAQHQGGSQATGSGREDVSLIDMPPRRRPRSGRRSLHRDSPSASSPALFDQDVADVERMYLETAEFESDGEDAEDAATLDASWDGSMTQELRDVHDCMRDVMASTAQTPEVPEEPEVHDPDPIRTQRMAKLRKEGQRLLGSQFVPVYEYLKQARKDKLPEAEIKKTLGTMAEYRNCFVVDQLVYMECFC